MKKLMFAACAIAFAGVVQAATYNWSVASSAETFNGYDAPDAQIGKLWSDATPTAGMSWYLVYANDYAQSAALADLRGSGLDSSKVLASGSTVAAKPGIAKKTFTTDSETFALDKDGNMSAYLVIVNADGDYAYIGATTTVPADTKGGTSDYAIATATTKKLVSKDTETAYSNPGWYAAVPEPTSGLLLLLGVAGLALRRRRA